LKKLSTLILVLAILTAAAGFRIWGLDWGLPTKQHFFSYHPDETILLNAAISVDLLSGHLDPGFYNYGSLYVFLSNLAITTATLLGAINIGGDPLSSIGEFAKVYMSGRVVTVTLGILTVYLMYALGRRMHGRLVGLLAAAFMAIAPIHVMHSRFMTVDVPATFFVALSLLYAARIPDDDRWRNYILAGLHAGFAAATKYNAGLVVIALGAAHLASINGRPLLLAFHRKWLGGIAAAAAGFLIGCPGSVLNTQAFVRDFRFEALHAGSGHGLLFAGTGSGFSYHLMHSLLPGLGPALLIPGILGVVLALTKARPLSIVARILTPWRLQIAMPQAAVRDLMLIAFLASYYTLIGIAQVRFARYTMPILPVVLLLGARIVIECARTRRITAVIVATATTACLLYTAAYTAALSTVFASADTRDEAAVWVRTNVPEGSSIALPTTPWFYTPPLLPSFGQVNAEDRLAAAEDSAEYVFVVDGREEWNARLFAETAPDYAILSEFEYEDRRRVGDMDYKRYFEILKQDYELEKRFSRRPAILGMPFPLQWEMPHDMSYASPEILIYRRSGQSSG